ncbi:NRDE-2, necessary for RNA interference-domain-containing protein [Phakopsora pachyrhizi]|nr:NRDE-2, necessary for RNA interference-domain-containing protein [Phakopsora pachyrhizi]
MDNQVPSFDNFPSCSPRPMVRGSSSELKREIDDPSIQPPYFDSFPENQISQIKNSKGKRSIRSDLTSKRDRDQILGIRDEELESDEKRETSTDTHPDAADGFLNSIAIEISDQLKFNHQSQNQGSSKTSKKYLSKRKHFDGLIQEKKQTKGLKKKRKDSKRSESSEKPIVTPSNLSTSQTDLSKISLYGEKDSKATFTIALKEDTFNLYHLRPDKSKVPRYRRSGGGSVLGLHPKLRITRDSAYRGDGLLLSDQGRSKEISISDPSVILLLNDKNLKRISLTKSTSTDVEHVEFIPLLDKLSKNSSIPSSEQRDVPNQVSENHHIGVPELYYEASDSDSDLVDYEPPEADVGESLLESLNRKKSELERKIRKEPSDIETWLELVSLQDEMKELGLVGLRARAVELDQEDVRRHAQGTSDVKLSYLKQALVTNPENEALLLAYMRAFCDQPDVDPAKEWRRILELHPKITGLWIAFVDWKQSDAATMNVNQMVEVYEELISRLAERAEDTHISGRERNEFEQNLIYLFHRCAVMLRQAGYSEKAMAAFQAIIEINFMGSVDMPNSINEIIEDFEAFWDSEVPRVGEPGAKGWINSNLEDEPPPRSFFDEFNAKPKNDCPEDLLERWRDKELEVRLPLRTSDPENEQDPFGCILFDDLRNLCFFVTSYDSRQALLYSFLSFIGVSTPPPDVSNPFLSSELIDEPNRQKSFWPKIETTGLVDENGVPEKRSGIRSPLTIPLRPSQWFSNLEPPVRNLAFIRNAFKLLRDCPLLKDDTYFKLSRDPSSAVKIVKQILSQDQTNWTLWDTYARLCLRRGKERLGREAYVKTLEMVPESTRGLESLWYSWAEMEFQVGNSELVISILARAMKCIDESPCRAFIGKITGLFDRNAPIDIARNRVSTCVGFSMFQYLTQGFEAACEVYEESLKVLIESGVEGEELEEEELWMSYCKLVFDQIDDRNEKLEKRRSYRPIQVREILKRSIERFPNNSIFIALFGFNESRMRIDNETRRLVETIILKDSGNEKRIGGRIRRRDFVNCKSWLYSIWIEMNLNHSGYNDGSVRNLFERAVRHEKSKFCLQIWRLYFEFEVKNQNFSRSRSILTRSFNFCPWSKELYLLLLLSDKKQLQEEEQRKKDCDEKEGGKGGSKRKKSFFKDEEEARQREIVLKLIEEKGIRIRDLKFIKSKQQKESLSNYHDGSDDDNSLIDQDEIEEFEERKKLLPY